LAAGTRSNLYTEMLRVMRETSVHFAFFENVERLLMPDLFSVFLRDLETDGYSASWCVVRASDVGLPHARSRVWILAYKRLPPVPPRVALAVVPPARPGLPPKDSEPPRLAPARQMHRRDRLRILGNAWVPAAAVYGFIACCRIARTRSGGAPVRLPVKAFPRAGRFHAGVLEAFPSVSRVPSGPLWPTPTVNDAKNDGGPSQRRRNSPNVNGVLAGPPNADWVEMLMGWPIGFTALR